MHKLAQYVMDDTSDLRAPKNGDVFVSAFDVIRITSVHPVRKVDLKDYAITFDVLQSEDDDLLLGVELLYGDLVQDNAYVFADEYSETHMPEGMSKFIPMS